MQTLALFLDKRCNTTLLEKKESGSRLPTGRICLQRCNEPGVRKEGRRAKLVLDFVIFHLTFDVCADKCLLYAIDFGLDVVDANADVEAEFNIYIYFGSTLFRLKL